MEACVPLLPVMCICILEIALNFSDRKAHVFSLLDVKAEHTNHPTGFTSGEWLDKYAPNNSSTVHSPISDLIRKQKNNYCRYVQPNLLIGNLCSLSAQSSEWLHNLAILIIRHS